MKKLPSGITGFDEVTGGGLPEGRPTLVAGGPGCGKTLMALTVIAHAAEVLQRPAVFLSFEELPADIVVNAESIGLDLSSLLATGQLALDFAGGGLDTVQEIGTYTLDGLIIRLSGLLAETGATIVAIDTIETLYSMFGDQRAIRRELARLFQWCKERSVTLIVTCEVGDNTISRYGLEEYVSDCVILMSHTVINDVSTRRLRIIKYRGARHGTNEFPFIIGDNGIQVMPITAAALDYPASTQFALTGVMQLDQLLGGEGLRRGRMVLVTGKPGAGKTNLAMTVAKAAVSRDEKVVFFSFEESPRELESNVASVGIGITDALKSGRLVLSCARPTLRGLEHHMVEMYRVIEENNPTLAIIDPLSGLYSAGTRATAYRTLVRLVDTLKGQQITVLATSSQSDATGESSDFDVAPMSDVWVRLDYETRVGGFQRSVEVVKARGLDHHRGAIDFEIRPSGLKFGPIDSTSVVVDALDQ